MELLISLAMKFWQWSLLIALVIVGLIINLLDRRKSNCTFHYEELPHLQPIKISTKGKGFFKGIVMWLLGTRNWKLLTDFRYKMNGTEYVIPEGFSYFWVSGCQHVEFGPSNSDCVIFSGLRLKKINKKKNRTF